MLSISAVLALDTMATGRAAIAALAAQTIAPRMELVLVGPKLEHPGAAADRIAKVTLVDAPLEPLSSARAVGIDASSGRAVFVAETHGYPRPDCLELLAQAIASGASAAMPRIVNANPATARSWATLFCSYGSFTSSRPRRLAAVALHNAAFERRALTTVAKRPSDLVYGVGLSQAFAAQGSEMQFVPAAAIDHLNVASWHGVLADSLIGGQLWAGMRSRDWAPSRRAAHVVGTPLAALVMLARTLRSDGWRELGGSAPHGTACVIGLCAAVQVVGELAGYARGPGTAERRHLPLELHRERYV
jgi:hypothetical protein